MACYYIKIKDYKTFLKMLEEKDHELIVKMVKCVLSALKRNKETIDIFDITFQNRDSLVFSTDKSQYKELLNNYLPELVKMEEYELCVEVKNQLNKKTRKKKSEVL